MDDIRSRSGASTTETASRRLKRLIRAADPDANVSLLSQTAEECRRELRARRPRIERFSTKHLLSEGRQMMEQAKVLLAGTRFSEHGAMYRKILFRDGLMIALLALRPLRLRSFVSLRLRESIVLYRDDAWIYIPGTLSKTGLGLNVPFPQELFPELLFYLSRVRNGFPNADKLADLWISNQGAAMSERLASHVISLLPIFWATCVTPQPRPTTTTRRYNQARQCFRRT
jgi:hypothetical protein